MIIGELWNTVVFFHQLPFFTTPKTLSNFHYLPYIIMRMFNSNVEVDLQRVYDYYFCWDVIKRVLNVNLKCIDKAINSLDVQYISYRLYI